MGEERRTRGETAAPGGVTLVGRAAAPAAPAAPRRRLDRLTALRGPAALVVFSRHWIETFHATSGSHVFVQAASVVSFFFMLSGFVLAYGYRPGDRPATYFRRRAARIYPLYLLALAAGAVINHAQLSLRTVIPALLLVQSFIPNPRYYYAVAGVSWSLSVEVFMYLLFPVLILGVVKMSRPARTRLLVALIACGWALPLLVRSTQLDTGVGYWVLYIFPVTRLLEFVIGMLLALMVKEGWRPPVSTAQAFGLSVAALVAGSWLPIYVGWVALTLIPFALLVPAAAVDDIAGKPSILHTRKLVLAGEVSYAFYLLHRPVMAVWHKVIPDPSVAGEVVMFATSITVASVIALAAHKRFEVPLDRYFRGDGRGAVTSRS